MSNFTESKELERKMTLLQQWKQILHENPESITMYKVNWK